MPQAIHGFRETERLQWRPENERVLRRVRRLALPPGTPPLRHVHVLDLAADGVIKPHVDSRRVGHVDSRRVGHVDSRRVGHVDSRRVGHVDSRRVGHVDSRRVGHVDSRRVGHVDSRRVGHVDSRRVGHVDSRRVGPVTSAGGRRRHVCDSLSKMCCAVVQSLLCLNRFSLHVCCVILGICSSICEWREWC